MHQRTSLDPVGSSQVLQVLHRLALPRCGIRIQYFPHKVESTLESGPTQPRTLLYCTVPTDTNKGRNGLLGVTQRAPQTASWPQIRHDIAHRQHDLSSTPIFVGEACEQATIGHHVTSPDVIEMPRW
jgi:hypothetical protein